MRSIVPVPCIGEAYIKMSGHFLAPRSTSELSQGEITEFGVITSCTMVSELSRAQEPHIYPNEFNDQIMPTL